MLLGVYREPETAKQSTFVRVGELLFISGALQVIALPGFIGWLFAKTEARIKTTLKAAFLNSTI
jgi:hypothetical protein